MGLNSGRISFVDQHPGYEYSFPTNLYNLPEHLKLLPFERIASFFMVDRQRKLIDGTVNFVLTGDQAISLPRRPFGFFEINQTIGFNVIHDFVNYVVDRLMATNAREILLKSYASYYSPRALDACAYALAVNGFVIEKTEINHFLSPDRRSYRSILKQDEARKLRKCERRGFVFSEEPSTALDEIFGFICACRNERRQVVNITQEELRLSFARFPNYYKMFSARSGDRIAAASISVIVKDGILYDFMHASPLSFNPFSPVVFLINGIYDFCRQRRIHLIDLGGSVFADQPLRSLIQFKENIGGIPSVKFTFKKTR